MSLCSLAAVGVSMIAALASVACSPKVETSPPSPPAITGLPVKVQVKQRSTQAVPGSNEKLSVSIDDITRGQVMVGLSHADGRSILGTRSLGVGGSARFDLDGSSYVLAVDKLDNSLVGADFATITISQNEKLTEAQKIEQLIAKVEGLTDAVFIRNGAEHSADAAGKLMRHKLRSLDPAKTTAVQFIEHAGTKSSTTGQPYSIRFSDGTTKMSADFLREELARIEGQ